MDFLEIEPFLVSFRLAAWTTGILLLVGFPLAWVFARSKRVWVPFIESVFSLSLVLPPTVLGFYLLLIFSPYSPVGAFLADHWGLRLTFTFPGLVIASCLASFPFMLTALRTGIQAVPETLFEASWTLGRGTLATALEVVVPNMMPSLISGLITTFARTLGEFGVVMMVGGSIPGVTKVVSIAIYERTEIQDWPAAHAYALVLVGISYAAVLTTRLLERRAQ